MPTNHVGRETHPNHLIAALPPSERAALLARTTQVTLAGRDIISQRYQPLANVYFPLSGMVSLVTTMRDGSTIEMATIGREGMIGVPMMSRRPATSGADAVIQVAGDLLRMPTAHFQALLGQTEVLPALVGHFSEGLFQLVSQNAACNRLHTADQRLSRWLLTTQDRIESPELPLTHEFLGQMLGVRRQSVSEAAEEFQSRGLISYRRGNVTILDRPGLEATACECYEVMRTIFEGLYD
ncbi:MAG: Crp/Fnr family transcriptional regulator [Actinomycetota bacterium]